MNILFTVSLGAFILVSYKIGMFAWGRIIKAEGRYYRILFCGASTLLLTVILASVMLMESDDELFSSILGINLLQAIVSIGLLAILHFEVTWARTWSLLKENRNFILFPTLIFFAGLAMGLALESSVYDVVSEEIEDLGNIASLSLDRPAWQIAVFIFGNNTKTAILLGVALPLIPVLGGIYVMFSMLLNGAIVGVCGAVIDEPVQYFLLGILPHGIFEIPGILIASAVGLRLNSKIVFGILAAFREGGEGATKTLVAYLREGMESWDLMYLVILLLLVAALIESTITPLLLSGF